MISPDQFGGRYVGEAGKNRSGPNAEQLDSRARVLANRALAKIKYRGGGQQFETEIQPDGSVIRCLVIHNLAVPIVRWWIERPGGGEEEQRKFFIPESYHAPFVWEPEGFVITPRSKSQATQGWGMPRLAKSWDEDDITQSQFEPINEGRGTPNNELTHNQLFHFETEVVVVDNYYLFVYGHKHGAPPAAAIREVLINKFQHNKYPERLFDLAWESMIELAIQQANKSDDPATIRAFYERLKEKFTTASWPVFFKKTDPIIVRYHGPSKDDPEREIVFLYGWQFKQFQQITGAEIDSFSRLKEYNWSDIEEIIDWKRLERETEEEETADWFCHWPEENQYDDAFRLEFFKLINTERPNDDQLTFPLKGIGWSSAQQTAEQIRKHKTLAHNYVGFDDGYESASQRLVKNGHPGGMSYEVLNCVGTPGDLTYAAASVDAFYQSPNHWWGLTQSPLRGDMKNCVGELAIGKSSAVITKQGDLGDTWSVAERDEPLSGLVTVGHIHSRDHWVGFGDVVWEGEDGLRVSWKSERTFRYGLIELVPRLNTSLFKGKYYWDAATAETRVGEVVRTNSNQLFYKGRAIVFSNDYNNKPCFVMGGAFWKDEDVFVVCLLQHKINHDGNFPSRDDISVTNTLHFCKVPYSLAFAQEDLAGDEEKVVDPEIIYSIELDTTDYAISHVHFSQDGSKCVFSVMSTGSVSHHHHLNHCGPIGSTPVAWEYDWGVFRFFAPDGTPAYGTGYTGSVLPDAIFDAHKVTSSDINFSLTEIPSFLSSNSKIRQLEFNFFSNRLQTLRSWEPRTSDAGSGYRHGAYMCDDEGAVYVDYVNNEPVFATVHIAFNTTPVVFGTPLLAAHIKTLTLPGAEAFLLESMEYAEVDDPDVIYYHRYATNNLLRQLLHVDMRNPDDLCYEEWAWVGSANNYIASPGPFDPELLSVRGAARRRVFIKDEQIFEAQNPHNLGPRIPLTGDFYFMESGKSWDDICYPVVFISPQVSFYGVGAFTAGTGFGLGKYYPYWGDTNHVPAEPYGLAGYDRIEDVTHTMFVDGKALHNMQSFMPCAISPTIDTCPTNIFMPSDRYYFDLKIVHSERFKFVRYNDDYIAVYNQEAILFAISTLSSDTYRYSPHGFHPDSILNLDGECYTSKLNNLIDAISPSWKGTVPVDPSYDVFRGEFIPEDKDEAWIIRSSLDLDTITGIENLSLNIWPCGVI